MRTAKLRILPGVFLLLALSLLPGGMVRARPPSGTTPAELISAVNNLRIAYGLAPLAEHPILTQTAQMQADALLATSGAVGHTRPNGITFTQQLLILGYPLSGDLSLGGYRSENFIFGYQLTPIDAVEAWKGDEPHLNTMISPNRSDIGAGVAISADGQIYYVIDTALRTASGLPQSETERYLPGGALGDTQSAISQYIVPITLATARPNGDVFHIVQYGQSLWGIAIEYGTKIDLIRQLNHLGSDNTVFPNQLLLVKQGATHPASVVVTPPAVETSGPELYMTDTIVHDAGFLQATMPALEPTGKPVVQRPSSQGLPASIWIALVVFLLIVGAGSAVFFIRDPESR